MLNNPPKPVLVIICAGLIALISSCPGYAADDSRIWASQCFQCHGTNGNPVGDMDEIGGKDAHSLYEKLLEMKYRGKTENIMDLHARGYSDEQLRAIAKYVSLHGSEEDGVSEEDD